MSLIRSETVNFNIYKLNINDFPFSTPNSHDEEEDLSSKTQFKATIRKQEQGEVIRIDLI